MHEQIVSPDDQQLRRDAVLHAAIIRGAFVLGSAAMVGVFIYLVTNPGQSQQPTSPPPVAGSNVAGVDLIFVVVIAVMTMKGLLAASIAPLLTASIVRKQVDPARTSEEPLINAYRVMTIVVGAILEAAALIAGITILLTSAIWPAAVAGICILAMLATFPRAGSLDSFIHRVKGTDPHDPFANSTSFSNGSTKL